MINTAFLNEMLSLTKLLTGFSDIGFPKESPSVQDNALTD